MLSLEIKQSGGVEITGTKEDLLTLAWWINKAAEEGCAEPAFVSDIEITSVKIMRREG